jgi:Flp pilus assembly pilin Flp
MATLLVWTSKLREIWACREVEGQGLVEYALIILFVVLACFGAVSALGTKMDAVFWKAIKEVLIPAMGG